MVMAIAQSVVECRVHIAETNRGGRYYYVYVVQCHTSRKPESPTMPADSTWPCVTTVTSPSCHIIEYTVIPSTLTCTGSVSGTTKFAVLTLSSYRAHVQRGQASA